MHRQQRITTGGFLALALAAGWPATLAADTALPFNRFAATYGPTLPPIGFVSFCARYPEECKGLGQQVSRVHLTAARWRTLNRVNTTINRRIRPVTDLELYNRPEVWEFPTSAGDCEDYVLLKKRHLEGLGFPAETLLITVVLDEKGAGHAVLMVRTDRGDYVLDNRRDDIRLYSRTGYRLLKRQSQRDPAKWVALERSERINPRIFGEN